MMQGSIIGLDGHVIHDSGGATRIARFGRAFTHVLADLDPSFDPPVLDGNSSSCMLIPRRGNAGEVIFLLGVENDGDNTEQRLVLRDGRSLDCATSSTGHWCLLNVDLAGRGRLDYSNVPIIDLLNRKVLIAYGVPGTRACIGIDGSDIEMFVPEADAESPLVQEHKDFVIVLCTEQQANMIVDDGESVFIGASGLDSDMQPVRGEGVSGITRIDSDGLFSSFDVKSPARHKSIHEELTWSVAALSQDLDG